MFCVVTVEQVEQPTRSLKLNPGEQMECGHAAMYPLNASLDEELRRLFSTTKDIREDLHTTYQESGCFRKYKPNTIPPIDAIGGSEEITHLHRVGGSITLQAKKGNKNQTEECVFCKSNGEEPRRYQTHSLRDADDRVSCPILRAYVCPICGAKGDNAHTIKYCPRNNKAEMIFSSNVTNHGPREARTAIPLGRRYGEVALCQNVSFIQCQNYRS